MQAQSFARASSRYVKALKGMKPTPTQKGKCEHKRESFLWFITCTFVTQN
jgi:hypothetical protein